MPTIKFLRQSQTGGSGLPPTTPNRLGQLILNTARPGMALQTVNGAPSPTISTAIFGPALVTNGDIFPAPRDSSIKSWEFAFSTSRGIGPGLFYQEPLKQSLTPAVDILAGSFQQAPNHILLIGSNSNPQVFANPTSSLVGDVVSLGANSGNVGKRTIAIGSSAQPNQVVANGEPADGNIAIGLKAMSGIFSQPRVVNRRYPISTNVAVGAEAMGISPLSPTVKGAASNSVVLGAKSGLGFLGRLDTYEERPDKFLAEFTVLGAKSWWLKSDLDNNRYPYGNSVILGVNSYQNTLPGGESSRTVPNNSNFVGIGSKIATTSPTVPFSATIIGGDPTLRDPDNYRNPNSVTYITPKTRPNAVALETPINIDDGKIEVRGSNIDTFYFGRRDDRLMAVMKNRFFPTEAATNPYSINGFGPFVSAGNQARFLVGDGTSQAGFTAANGTFKDSTGKTYTVKNGLITSVA